MDNFAELDLNDVKKDLMECIRQRNVFYECFCRRAKEEGDLPQDMYGFIIMIVEL